MKKKANIIIYENTGKHKNIEENCANVFEEIDFEFMSPVTPQQNGMEE